MSLSFYYYYYLTFLIDWTTVQSTKCVFCSSGVGYILDNHRLHYLYIREAILMEILIIFVIDHVCN